MKFYFFLVGFLLWPHGDAAAEPWLANRFAQNCASCHNPGRLAKQPSARRCTLSCQSCHVNPSGGGLRTAYGAWNQQRWLRSFFTGSFLTERKRPAPFKYQLYAKNSLANSRAVTRQPANDEGGEENSEDGQILGNPFQAALDAPVAPPPAAAPKRPKQGFPTVVWERSDIREADFANTDGQDKILAQNQEQFLDRITSDDPYREERRSAIAAGVDMRTIGLFETGNSPDIWLMNVDLGIRFRPTPEHVRMVFESRFLAGPKENALDQAFTTESRVRSAYVLFDDYFGNSFFQYGLYRPMFGNQDGDFTSLSAAFSELDQRAVFHAGGIGAAPGVTYFQLHLIRPMTDRSFENSKGYALSAGLRFRTLGASLGVSYWNTDQPLVVVLSKTMFSVHGGIVLGPVIVTGEFLSVKKKSTLREDSGSVLTGEVRTRLWREIYAQGKYAKGSTATNLAEGSSNQFTLGMRGFLSAGLDVELAYFSRNETLLGAEQTNDGIRSQVHLYF